MLWWWTQPYTTRTPFEFGGRRLRLGLNGSRASDQALEAVRRFMAERGTLPTAASWTRAGMSPSEKTIRRRFGSFKAAVQCAGAQPGRAATGTPNDERQPPRRA